LARFAASAPGPLVQVSGAVISERVTAFGSDGHFQRLRTARWRSRLGGIMTGVKELASC